MSDWRDNDYTKNRNTGVIPYNIEDKIGRKDPTYITAVEIEPTVSGTTLRTNYR